VAGPLKDEQRNLSLGARQIPRLELLVDRTRESLQRMLRPMAPSVTLLALLRQSKVRRDKRRPRLAKVGRGAIPTPQQSQGKNQTDENHADFKGHMKRPKRTRPVQNQINHPTDNHKNKKGRQNAPERPLN
jgi:hypothetical protein